jgi:hypothetical protein
MSEIGGYWIGPIWKATASICTRQRRDYPGVFGDRLFIKRWAQVGRWFWTAKWW